MIGNAINIEPQYKDGSMEVSKIAHIRYGEWNGKYSLGVVPEGNKLLWNSAKDQSSSDDQATNSCTTALDATREAVRKNWKYLRAVNLADTHLERIQLYLADLNGTGFNRANLHLTKASGFADFTFAYFTSRISGQLLSAHICLEFALRAMKPVIQQVLTQFPRTLSTPRC